MVKIQRHKNKRIQSNFHPKTPLLYIVHGSLNQMLSHHLLSHFICLIARCVRVCVCVSNKQNQIYNGTWLFAFVIYILLCGVSCARATSVSTDLGAQCIRSFAFFAHFEFQVKSLKMRKLHSKMLSMRVCVELCGESIHLLRKLHECWSVWHHIYYMVT